MARRSPSLPAEDVRDYALTLRDYKLGTITLLEENRTPNGAVVESLNLVQVQDGVWAPKWGADYYSIEAPAALDGAFPVVNPDNSTEILEIAAGVIYRSTNGGAKTVVTITNGSLTTGKKCFFKQIRGYVYITNNYDAVIRYDTVTKAATGYVALATPAAPTLGKTGLSGSSLNAYYIIVATNLVGTTVGSAEAVIAVGKDRDSWAGTTLPNTTDFVTLTITRVANAARYSIFYADQSGYELFLTSVADPGGAPTTFTYVDDGTIAVNQFVELPNDDTTGGPILGLMELSGNRLWALDGENPWRVNWGGVGQYMGIFSPFYGGGYIDLEKGGRERPTNIEHFRDGKGSSLATVLTVDPEGNGSTWQISLDTVTVGSTSFIVPSAVKIVGSIGCAGPRAAAKVGDDVIFGNSKGAYSLGSQPSLLNVLSTRELSANIRTSWRALTNAAMKDLACYYYDAKLFWSVPNTDTKNSEIWIRDSEKRNWQVGWRGLSIASFFEYADSTGRTHFLGVPVNGTRLIEFSPEIRGDFGQAFKTRLKTGIIPIDKDHNKFAQINDVFLEVGRPLGRVHLDIYGYDYKKAFTFLASLDVDGGATSGADWGEEWSTQPWSTITDLPILNTPSVVRKRKRLNKLVNNLQYVVTTENLADYYELLEIHAAGFLVNVDPPRAWKVGSNTPGLDRNLTDYLLDEDGSQILDSDGNPISVV